MEQALKFEEEFSIRCFLHETRLPRATAKRSSIYYYSKDAEDEEEEGEENGRRSKRRRRCIREESWRNNLTSSLYSLYSFPSTARTLFRREMLYICHPTKSEKNDYYYYYHYRNRRLFFFFIFHFFFFFFLFSRVPCPKVDQICTRAIAKSKANTPRAGRD